MLITNASKNILERVEFSALPHWDYDDHAKALLAFRQSAQEILSTGHGFRRPSLYGGTREDWLAICSKAGAAHDARHFFETEFQAISVAGQSPGLFTGYYEPQVRGSLSPNSIFTVPIYARPPELFVYDVPEHATANPEQTEVQADLQPYFTRQQIEQSALKHRGLELCYVHSWEDAYFIHIQGNGCILLDDGRALHLSFAAKNGHTYKSIGRVLLARGVGTAEIMSMQFLKSWMSDNPKQARELMWENPSFIFFKADTKIHRELGAVGAAQVQLTPLRSLAVDRAIWALGTPLFLSTHLPPQAGGDEFNHLMIAQDTGSAIKGIMRGDIYFGWGKEAELAAGHMQQPGKIIALLPKSLAKRLLP